MGLIDKPLLTVGAILLACIAEIGGIVFVVTGDATYAQFLALNVGLAAPFTLASGYARGQQAQGQATKNPYE